MKKEAKKYVDGYKAFLAEAKTERRAYAKTLFAAVVGRAGTSAGVRVVGGHTDAPRLDLKPKPIYEKGGITYFDTHIYGGIKKYQWLVLPLALYGTVAKKDGTRVDVAVGDAPGDPAFMISDILPHFGKEQLEKKVKDAVAAEDMDVIAGLGKIEDVLKKKFGVEKDDLLSAELEIVPAGAPRDVGLDRALVAAYGHDDRVCAYAGLAALVDVARAKAAPARTCAVVLCDKEEIGSVGASGMESSFFENTVAELIDREGGGARDIDVRRALEASQRATRISPTPTRLATRRASARVPASSSTPAPPRRAARATRARSSSPRSGASSTTPASRGRWASSDAPRRAAAVRSRSSWRASAWTWWISARPSSTCTRRGSSRPPRTAGTRTAPTAPSSRLPPRR